MPTYNSVDLRDCAADTHDADEDGNCAVCGKTCLHGHEWGPVEEARMTGNPHRKCLKCRFITLDLEDEHDPHCTCNDCMHEHITSQEEAIREDVDD